MARTLTVVGLVGAALGIWIQAFSGVPDYGTVLPPGPIILVLIGAAIGLTSRWWWTPIAGAALSGLIIVGAFVHPGTGARLTDPGAIGPFTGTLMQMVSLVLGVLAGLTATVQGFLARSRRA